jgi:hypothetical protein
MSNSTPFNPIWAQVIMVCIFIDTIIDTNLSKLIGVATQESPIGSGC